MFRCPHCGKEMEAHGELFVCPENRGGCGRAIWKDDIEWAVSAR